ncbi:sigma-54 interaction domain-containing protein [Pararhodospirillum photometricum]|uniref:Sigma-54 factor interaction domain-containing protein n=1 Tax=Pararhodospirillum photometricum DSM 122 TaxID=1150469 RepID=H6SN13_PARPM|nr:sigma 54-interacting transcriptional regulator [Pararhodospirillum photometricum]CCG06889.1 unnamed protein product [Pararhodospirillum photometricum DSM 122]
MTAQPPRPLMSSASPGPGFARLLHAPDSPLTEVIAVAHKIAVFDIPVLLTGESGTGKELLARAIHDASPRAGGAFVVENCGALPDPLLESELFGCRKGAFTGAHEDRIGLFEQANGGTIFLDEIGETSPAFQVKLLRVLQEGEIRPLGASVTRKVNVRVLTATNRDLEEEVRDRRFRRDLYYRLAGFPIHLPALRHRPGDLPLLAEAFARHASSALNKPVAGLTPEALARLARHDWPGNVRELYNEIQRMVALAESPWLDPSLFSPTLALAGDPDPTPVVGTTGTLRTRVERFEAEIIDEALERHNGNISRVARDLGLSRVGLRGKMLRYGLAGGREEEGEGWGGQAPPDPSDLQKR